MQDHGTLRYEMGYACAIAVVLFVLMFVFFTALLIAELSILFRQIKIGPEQEKE